jgi:ferritin-like metal-binding protein YciE
MQSKQRNAARQCGIIRGMEDPVKTESLHELYIEQLKDLYSAETQLTKALPKVAKAADSSALRTAIEKHLKETEQQRSRIEKIFEDLDQKPGGKKCHGMAVLLEEGTEAISEFDKGPVRDAALIAAAQRVEHYEIAGYGTVCEYARSLGRDRDLIALKKTLEEESAANEKLSEIATSNVNESAKAVAAS